MTDEKHLVWVKEDYSPPNPKYHCVRYLFYVNSRVEAIIHGPCEGVPGFNVQPYGRKKHTSLDEAISRAISQWKKNQATTIFQMQSALDAVRLDYNPKPTEHKT